MSRQKEEAERKAAEAEFRQREAEEKALKAEEMRREAEARAKSEEEKDVLRNSLDYVQKMKKLKQIMLDL